MSQSDLAKGILSYLIEKPDAQDTREGIAGKWLLHQRIREQVDQALAELVEEGFLEEISGAESSIYYRIPAAKRNRVGSLLESHS